MGSTLCIICRHCPVDSITHPEIFVLASSWIVCDIGHIFCILYLRIRLPNKFMQFPNPLWLLVNGKMPPAQPDSLSCSPAWLQGANTLTAACTVFATAGEFLTLGQLGHGQILFVYRRAKTTSKR